MFGFRQAVPKDIDEIMRIAEAGKKLLKSRGIDQWQKAGYPDRELFINDIEQGISYVMTDDDKPMAICCISFANEPAYDSIEGEWLTPKDTYYAVAHRGALAPEYQGQHLTGIWFKYIIDFAREHGAVSVRIDTHDENEGMKKVFKNAGFKRCGTVYLHGGDCGKGEPRIAFELVL